jgi:lipoate-protein ligase A
MWFNRAMAGPQLLSVYESEGPPAEDLAREALLMENAAKGDVSLFLTSWSGPVVVVGYGQKTDGLNLEWCRSHGLPVLRRISGGTGVVHRGDLGVGLVLPQAHSWSEGIVSLYDRFLGILEPALRSLGSRVARVSDPGRTGRVRSPICFLDQLSDTLVVDGRKAVGCAQTRRQGAVLIHAAVLLGLDPEIYSKVFGVRVGDVERGLAPALDGADWREAGKAIASHLAEALEAEVVERIPEPVPDHLLDRYRTEKWAPVRG